MRHIYLILIILFYSSLSGCENKPAQWPVLTGETMGTYYSVSYNPTNPRIVDKRLRDQIEKLLDGINRTMSTYIEDSELSLLNQVNIDLPVTISEELFYVLQNGQKVSELSNGAFDITVGSLVNLWGFGPEFLQRQIPDERDIEFLKLQVGYQKLILNENSLSIAKTVSGMYLDLSAIAKGYAVDRIAEHLQSLNIHDYLIDIGGELIGKGNNQNNELWQIGIEQAQPLSRKVQRIISLKNMAMATSGDYRNYFEYQGKRYSHTIDPRTGKPVSHNLASVTVLHEKCLIADALATAILVMGKENGLALADRIKTPVYMISRSKNGFIEHYNDLFLQYLNE